MARGSIRRKALVIQGRRGPAGRGASLLRSARARGAAREPRSRAAPANRRVRTPVSWPVGQVYVYQLNGLRAFRKQARSRSRA